MHHRQNGGGGGRHRAAWGIRYGPQVKRVLALVAAVAMVAGAYVVRGGGADDDGGRGDGGEVAVDGDPAASLRLVCATELADACALLAGTDDRLVVADEAPGVLADALLGGTASGADVWLAPRLWVELVRQLDEGSVLGEPSPVIARSPLVLAAFERTLPDCGGEPVGWRCIGDAAAAVRPGIQDLDDTEGLFTLAQAGSAYFGTAAYATNDFEVQPDDGGPPFIDWSSALLQAVPRSTFGTPLATMLRTDAATYDFAATIEAVATSAIRGTRREDTLAVIYPSPMATVDVVAVPVTGGDEGAAAELLGLLTGSSGHTALAEAGWRVEGEPLADGLDASLELDADDGLPEPGVLAALRERLG